MSINTTGFSNSVVGFALSKDKRFVVLSCENMSGIKGVMQEGERKAVQTMMREFFNKTGIATGEDEWTMIGDRLNPKEQSRRVYFFTILDNVMDIRQTSDEKIEYYHMDVVVLSGDAETKCIVPFALHWDKLGLMSVVLLEKK